MRDVKVYVLNGWASSEAAWSLCSFARDRIFSYLELADGTAERAVRESASPVLLVGWSMGGEEAIRLAAELPDKVCGLVLVAAMVRMLEDKAAGWNGMSEKRLEFFRIAMEMTKGQGFFGPPVGLPNPYEADTSGNLHRGIEYLRNLDLRESIRKIPPTVPIRAFHSKKDHIAAPQNLSFIKSALPWAEVEYVDGIEHALPIYIPRKIDEAVNSILRKV